VIFCFVQVCLLYYYFFDPGTHFPGNEKITLCNTNYYYYYFFLTPVLNYYTNYYYYFLNPEMENVKVSYAVVTWHERG